MSNLKQKYFVFCCYITDYTKISQLKTANYYLTVLIWVRIWAWINKVSLIKGLIVRSYHCCSGLPPSQGLIRKRCASKVMRVCGCWQASEGPLQACSHGCQQDSGPRWLLARGIIFLPCRPLHRATHIMTSLLLPNKGSEKERARKTEVTGLRSLI